MKIRLRGFAELASWPVSLLSAGKSLKPDITTEEIDGLVHQEIISHNAYPSLLGYGDFVGEEAGMPFLTLLAGQGKALAPSCPTGPTVGGQPGAGPWYWMPRCVCKQRRLYLGGVHKIGRRRPHSGPKSRPGQNQHVILLQCDRSSTCSPDTGRHVRDSRKGSMFPVLMSPNLMIKATCAGATASSGLWFISTSLEIRGGSPGRSKSSASPSAARARAAAAGG